MYNKSLKVDAKQLACAHSSLILANNFAPVSEALTLNHNQGCHMYPKEFYLVPEEIFILGNANTPKLSNVRPRDVDTMQINGITVIIANGKGISVFDREGINHSPMNGWVWRFPPNTQPPVGLRLVQDKPHHYCIAPSQNMPIDKYKGLLEEMALKASRVFKKEGKVV